MSYQLKYRTFDQLLDDASVDLKNLALENMIEPQQLIKVVRKINYELGLRIMQTKETVLEVCHHKVKLPDDFYVLNYALICGQYTVESTVPSGTNVQEISCPPDNQTVIYQTVPTEVNLCGDDPTPCTPTCVIPVTPSCCMNNCGDSYQLIQIIKTEKRTYGTFAPLRLRNNIESIDCDCPNLGWRCADEGWIKDGFLHTTLENCKIYLNYQGAMEDDEGNLLAPDHELLNEYYEYAVKERILENLFFDGEPVEQRLQYVAQKLRPARNNAMSVVNTPNFQEMKNVWKANRRAQYARYYRMFQSFGPRYSFYGPGLTPDIPKY